jgi:hypothetical protein
VQLLEGAGSCKHKSAYGAVFIRALQSAWHLIAAALRVAVLEQLLCFNDLNHFVRNEILDRSSSGDVPPHLSLGVNSHPTTNNKQHDCKTSTKRF